MNLKAASDSDLVRMRNRKWRRSQTIPVRGERAQFSALSAKQGILRVLLSGEAGREIQRGRKQVDIINLVIPRAKGLERKKMAERTENNVIPASPVKTVVCSMPFDFIDHWMSTWIISEDITQPSVDSNQRVCRRIWTGSPTNSSSYADLSRWSIPQICARGQP